MSAIRERGPQDAEVTEEVSTAYTREKWIQRAYRQPWLRLQMDLDDRPAAETTWLCCQCGHWFGLGELEYVRGALTKCVWCAAIVEALEVSDAD